MSHAQEAFFKAAAAHIFCTLATGIDLRKRLLKGQTERKEGGKKETNVLSKPSTSVDVCVSASSPLRGSSPAYFGSHRKQHD